MTPAVLAVIVALVILTLVLTKLANNYISAQKKIISKIANQLVEIKIEIDKLKKSE